MKRLSLLITIILCCIALCGCDVNFPFKPHVADAKPSRHVTVYVFGEVQNDGDVTVAEGADYNALLAEAGALPQTAWPAFPFTLVTEDTSFLAVQYVEGGKTYPGWTIYAAAGYSFTKIILAAVHVIRARKKKEQSWIVIRDIGLVDASVSILTLQTAMFAAFSSDDRELTVMSPSDGEQSIII